jgi:hypothetical protein
MWNGASASAPLAKNVTSATKAKNTIPLFMNLSPPN